MKLKLLLVFLLFSLCNTNDLKERPPEQKVSLLPPLPKLRNVDDPNKDPIEYSQQWINILEQLESSGLSQWGFAERFRALVIGDNNNGNINISSKCLSALSDYFERPLEKEWSFKSK